MTIWIFAEEGTLGHLIGKQGNHVGPLSFNGALLVKSEYNTTELKHAQDRARRWYVHHGQAPE